jgi:hypothetical protein
MSHLSRLILLLLFVPLMGCRGCTQAKPAKELTEKEKREEEKKKERIIASGMKTIPFGDNNDKDELEFNLVKPGHWYQANVRYKANLGDESLTASVSMRGKGGTKASYASGQAPLEFNRNFSLAKGQEKNVRMNFFQPEMPSTDESGDPSLSIVQANIELMQRSVGTRVYQNGSANKLIAGYQYYFVTLSRDPSRYLFWRGLDCIVWPSLTRFLDERVAPHRVIDLNEDQISSQFPDKLYAMTSISHIAVNDTSVSLMSPEQQEALRDWLFFGGTIILNGPDCVTGLDASFLKEFTPIITSGTEVLAQADIELLNRDWTIKQAGEFKKTPLSLDRPIPKLIGKLAPGAEWVPYTSGGVKQSLEGLLAERLVGQGRVVMSTFPMSDYGLLRWPSYSSLVHNAVLRKPNRKIIGGKEADTTYAGAFADSEFNPVHSTRLRLWARDLDNSTSAVKQDERKRKDRVPHNEMADGRIRTNDPVVETPKRTSLGSWNPEALVLRNAKNSLQESSGITVPKINTILKLLIGYLVILVPLNWLFFRLIGRVELAWVAAPLIALVGAFAVARGVQLDVGFSRSETSVGFLEVHSGHPRAVHSRYTALYTSLTTNYSTLFPKESGVVLPMPASIGETSRRPRGNLSTLEYWYADDKGSGLRNLSVLSNTTGLLHSEEVTEIRDGISGKVLLEIGKGEVENKSNVIIRDLGIIARRSADQLCVGWLGDIGPNETKAATLENRSDNAGCWLTEWDAKPQLAKPSLMRSDESLWTKSALGDELYLGTMLFELVRSYPFQVGESIAIGWTDSPIGSFEIAPSAKQKKQSSVLLVHLTPGQLSVAKPDEAIFPKISDTQEAASN